jgi:metallo-beta-lactamase family protein
MKIKFLGAAKTVTGSFFLVETQDVRFAIDCGLFQGSKEIKEKNYNEFTVNPQSIDFLVVTHAHIDHIGLIPKLCKHGFKGPIYCSHATEELAGVLLPDSGSIQESEVERKNRKLKRAGKLLLEPIYTEEDAVNCLSQFKSLNMDEIIGLAPGVEVRLRDAGHILGSCIIEVWVEEDNQKLKIVFSGDLGQNDQPIIKDPTIIENADYVVMESTYGDKYRAQISSRSEQLKAVIDETMANGGNLIIPAFAVERTQDLLYDLRCLYDEGKLKPSIDLYIDSPLAIAATKIFQKHIDCYDHTTREIMDSSDHPLMLPNLHFSRTQEESMRLNNVRNNTIIISASGMCDAGRIKHHLKHNLWRPESTILFVGYQAIGTLGRRILDGEKTVTIHGEKIEVRANIRTIEAYSAHADKKALIDWIKNYVFPPRGIFLVHGEEQAQLALAEVFEKEMMIPVYIPEWLDEYELKPAGRDLIKTHFTGENADKAILAEKLYLDLRLKLHEMFKNNWSDENYDKIIQNIKRLNTYLN